MEAKLKQRMTLQEMEAHMKENSFKIPSAVTIGLYAKSLGYKTYKPMIKGKIHFYYVNESIPK